MRRAVALPVLLLAACGADTSRAPAPAESVDQPAEVSSPIQSASPRAEPPALSKAPRRTEWETRLRGLPEPTRALRDSDVEDYIAVMVELGTPRGKQDGLATVLERRGVAAAWWDEMSSRVLTASLGWLPSRDMPVPSTWADDLAVVRPHRERIRAAIAY